MGWSLQGTLLDDRIVGLDGRVEGVENKQADIDNAIIYLNDEDTAVKQRVTDLETQKARMGKFTLNSVTKIGPTATESKRVKLSSLSHTFNVVNNAGVLSVVANFDIQADPESSPYHCLIVQCELDGELQQEQLLYAGASSFRGTMGQNWVFIGLKAGDHALDFYAYTFDGTTKTYIINPQHTGYTMLLFDNA